MYSVTLPYMSPIVADMVRVQRLIGARPAEVCSLTPGSFDRSGDVWVATLPSASETAGGSPSAHHVESSQRILPFPGDDAD